MAKGSAKRAAELNKSQAGGMAMNDLETMIKMTDMWKKLNKMCAYVTVAFSS